MIKRSFDIVFSSLVLMIGLPIYLCIALLILLCSGRPVFYTSRRIGYQGQELSCYKFRTMVNNADERLQEMLKQPGIKKEWQSTQKLKNDPRVSNIGCFLRKTSLDELPQFYNVLKGDLSVVGPRPVTAEELRRFGKAKDKILSIRPGITGLWQTGGRSLTSYKKRVALEVRYVEQQSFFSDLWLILKTIPMVFGYRGAY